METISELRAKASELRKIADKLDAAATALADLGGGQSSNGPQVSPRILFLDDPADMSALSGVEAIKRVLQVMGEPILKKDLLLELKARGKAIGENTLQSYLSRDKRFVSFGGGRWGLLDRKAIS